VRLDIIILSRARCWFLLGVEAWSERSIWAAWKHLFAASTRTRNCFLILSPGSVGRICLKHAHCKPQATSR